MAEEQRQGWHGDSEGHSEAAKKGQSQDGDFFTETGGGSDGSGDGSMSVKEAGRLGGEESGNNN